MLIDTSVSHFIVNNFPSYFSDDSLRVRCLQSSWPHLISIVAEGSISFLRKDTREFFPIGFHRRLIIIQLIRYDLIPKLLQLNILFLGKICFAPKIAWLCWVSCLISFSQLAPKFCERNIKVRVLLEMSKLIFFIK